MNPFTLLGVGCALVIVGLIVLVVLYNRGTIGLSQKRMDKINEWVDELQAKLEAKNQKKAAAVAAAAPVNDTAEKLKNLDALAAAGTIKPEEYAAARLKIITGS